MLSLPLLSLLLSALVSAAAAREGDEYELLCGEDLVASWNVTLPLSCPVQIVIEYDCCKAECEDINEGSIWNYVKFVECGNSLAGLRQFSLMIAVAYLIHILGTTADNFFCPVLEAITVTLKMSPQLAGATFLVIGNGAADVFTQIAASLEGNSDLGIGALMGAAIFVTCVVLARIHYIAKDMEGDGPVLLRDITFYFVSAVWIFAVTQDGYLTLVESVIGFVFYFIYIGVVYYMSKKEKARRASQIDSLSDGPQSDPEKDLMIEEQLANFGDSGSGGPEESPRSLQVGGQSNFVDSPVRIGLASGCTDVDEIYGADVALGADRGGDFDSDARRKLLGSARSISAVPSSEPYTYVKDLAERHGHEDAFSLDDPNSFSHRGGKLRARTYERHEAELDSEEHNVHRKPYRNHFAFALLKTVDEDYLATPNFRKMRMSVAVEKNELRRRRASMHQRASRGGYLSTWDVLRGGVVALWDQELEMFAESNYLWKFMYMIEFPFRFIRLLCIPDVTETNWNTFRAIASPTVAALWSLYMIVDTDEWGEPLWEGAPEGLSVALAVFVLGVCGSFLSLAFVSAWGGERPTGLGFLVYVLIAFAMSILWIMRICEELIATLNTLGILYKIPNAVLGATILAWGNSVADLFACTAVARISPPMALTAVFATPLFNLLVGLGSGGLITALITDPGGPGLEIANSELLTTAFAFTYASLVLSFVLYMLLKYRLRIWHANVLLFLYLGFIGVSVAFAIMYG